MKPKTQAQRGLYQDLPAVILSTSQGAQATISLLGGTLLGWQPAGGQPWIYLSPESQFEAGSAVRGGVPVIFPQFSNRGPLPRHGWVRNRLWQATEMRAQDQYALATVTYTSTEEDLTLWPHPFLLELTVVLEGNRLDMEWAVTNTGTTHFSFTGALHTYFAVQEVELCKLEGLQGLIYQDSLEGGAAKKGSSAALEVDGPIDRIYVQANRPLHLQDGARSLVIQQEGFQDVVVWNPWVEGARSLKDMPDRDFRKMLCIEAAAVETPITVSPQATWVGRQICTALPS